MLVKGATGCRYNTVKYNMNLHTSWIARSLAEYQSKVAPTKDNPYFTLMIGELWFVFCEYFGENWPHYNGPALYDLVWNTFQIFNRSKQLYRRLCFYHVWLHCILGIHTKDIYMSWIHHITDDCYCGQWWAVYATRDVCLPLLPAVYKSSEDCLPSNLQYKMHQIPKLECFLSRLVVAFVQYIEARC